MNPKATLGEIIGAYFRDGENNNDAAAVGRVKVIQRQSTGSESTNCSSSLALEVGTNLDT